MKNSYSRGFIAILLVFVFILYGTMAIASGLSSDEDETKGIDRNIPEATTQTQTEKIIVGPNITGISFTHGNDVNLKLGEKYSKGFIRVATQSREAFSPDDIRLVSENEKIAIITFQKVSQYTNVYYEITAVGPGSTAVYACTQDGTIMSDKINVTVPNTGVPKTIKINSIGHDLLIGESYQLSAVITPSDASHVPITWESSDNKIVTIDETGRILAVGIGTAIIRVTTINGISSTLTINARNPIVAKSISIDPISKDLKYGDTLQLKASISPSNTDDKTIVWKTNNEKVIQIDSKGSICVVGNGTATITATTSNGISSSISITIKSNPKQMKVSVSYSCTDYNSKVGSSWSHDFLVNGKDCESSMILSLSAGDIVKCYAMFKESDGNPDIGEEEIRHTITEQELTKGFTIVVNVVVTENGGRYRGQTTEYEVIFKFSPK